VRPAEKKTGRREEKNRPARRKKTGLREGNRGYVNHPLQHPQDANLIVKSP